MKRFKHLFSNRRGNVAAPGAIFFVVILVLVGGTLDMMSVSNQKSSLQDLADNAALAAVNELSISAQDPSRAKAVAKAFSEKSNLRILSVNTAVDLEQRQVTVAISAEPKTNFPKSMANLKSIESAATARLSGRGGNICMIGLSPSAISTLRLMSRAQITADTCAIYSNSTSTASMWVASTAAVTADLICVAGGYQGNTSDASGSMLEDCSPVSDPLAMRDGPEVGTCDFTNTVIRNGQTLDPGVYCGGLIVDGGFARLNSGDYIVTGGPLKVTNNGTLEGEYVGFYLSGTDAKIQFDYDSNIAISAPKEGVMTGLLLYSSPYENAAQIAQATSFSRTNGARDRVNNALRKRDGVTKEDHYIRSDNARRLVGTIYLPNGKLLIDGRRPIADRSEYTVIIADTFELQDGPNLVLRTDYHLSDIPVPEGVGPMEEKQARLVN